MKSKPTIYLSYIVSIFGLTVLLSARIAIPEHHKRPRARDIGIEVGVLKPGKWNAITDVLGVKVGHTTVIKGDSIRTGITAVLPHVWKSVPEQSTGCRFCRKRLRQIAGLDPSRRTR